MFSVTSEILRRALERVRHGGAAVGVEELAQAILALDAPIDLPLARRIVAAALGRPEASLPDRLEARHVRPAEDLLVDRSHMLTLTAPEMTVLVGGMRVLNANVGRSELGVLTKRPEMLTNDFFVNLLDMNTTWEVSSTSEHVFEGRDKGTGELKWTGTAVDLVFGSNSQLRAIAEVYACDDSQKAFVREFVAAWDKVMSLDRFDLA